MTTSRIADPDSVRAGFPDFRHQKVYASAKDAFPIKILLLNLPTCKIPQFRAVAQLVVYQYGVLGVACSSHVSPTEGAGRQAGFFIAFHGM
jgi:hypothetical protein